jgi:hypothetical protein
MKSVVKLDIDVDRPELAKLIADPKSSPKWMDDVRRVETLSGRLGATGSRYILVPKQGGTPFVATVVSRDLPSRLRLSLDAPRVTVAVNMQLIKLSANRTRLVSEQTFRFKSPFSRIYGFLARLAIRRAHRRHMESLKLVAEDGSASTRAVADA